VDLIIQAAPETDVTVISDVENQAEAIGALEREAKEYIPMNCDLDVAIAAIRMVKAEGTFLHRWT
jgi:DNA-binding NarL/FixJ family response regulator